MNHVLTVLYRTVYHVSVPLQNQILPYLFPQVLYNQSYQSLVHHFVLKLHIRLASHQVLAEMLIAFEPKEIGHTVLRPSILSRYHLFIINVLTLFFKYPELLFLLSSNIIDHLLETSSKYWHILSIILSLYIYYIYIYIITTLF